ncbi:site-specific integrase [Pseudomonas sp. P7779]|uniref:site-specific integrase n=1 Tax=Pseudomonas sp. P7779 TaxID=2738832 RepID=UPI0015BF6475|nr:site-specific integrase [Pseudomonas sp. P7779]NWC99760.1 site-specific integrase [Pseudomonas sp. P7779]
MAKANNLELQGGTYHVRLDVPKDVREAFGGRRVLSQSLKTGSREEALYRRLPILHAWKSQIKIARQGKQLPDGWQDNVAMMVEQLDQMATSAKRERIGERILPPPVPDPEAVKHAMENPEVVAALKAMIERRRREPMGMIKLEDDLADMFKGFVGRRLTESHNLTPDQKDELAVLIKDPSSYKARSPITKTRLAAFRTYRLEHHVALKTVNQQEAKLLSLSDHLQQSGSPLDFDAVSTWLQGMALSSKTKQQYLLAGSQFWQWACTHEPQWRQNYKGQVNPFEKHILPTMKGKAKKEAARKAFTIEEIGTLHAAAKEQGLSTLADLILLGTYSGGRIEELCQLRTENVITVEGVTMFDITDSKTVAGIRQVPIHPKLKRLVARLAAASADGFLIPSESKNKYGIRSDALSKAFGRLKTAQGFGSTHVFHSIRATVITLLVRADVPDRLIREIAGHESGTVTFDVYSKGSSPRQKLDAIRKLPTMPSH